MDEREWPTAGLTRRELRALREARSEEADGDPEREPAVAETPVTPDPASPGGPAPFSAGQPAAHGDDPHPIEAETVELPRELPPEGEDDDVHWDAPVPGVGVRVPIAERTSGRGSAAWPRAADCAASGAGEGSRPAAPVWSRVGTAPHGDTVAGAAAGADPEAGDGPDPDQVAAHGDPVLDAVDEVDESQPPQDQAPARARSTSSVSPISPASPTSPSPLFPPTERAPSSARPVPPSAGDADLPTLDDLLAKRPEPRTGPAELGWRGTVRRLTGGLVSPGPGPYERDRRRAIATVQRSLDGPRTVVVINPKGGAHKTTATLLIAATFGTHRGGYTLAWDNNETRGTLGWRSEQAQHHSTAVNLLQDLDRFVDTTAARVGDLDNYVRPQRAARFDVLASDEDAASAASIDAFAFRALHRTLTRFYRVVVVDTGNNMRASNWQAAIESADQVVIVSTVREDTAQSAAWAVDALRATGHEEAVRNAVTVLSAPAPKRDEELAARLHEHFGRLTRAVLDVPYDPSLVAGTPIDYGALADGTKDAWLRVTAAVAEGL